jgi:hypothetical protein
MQMMQRLLALSRQIPQLWLKLKYFQSCLRLAPTPKDSREASDTLVGSFLISSSLSKITLGFYQKFYVDTWYAKLSALVLSGRPSIHLQSADKAGMTVMISPPALFSSCLVRSAMIMTISAF